MNRWLIMLLSAATLSLAGCNKQESSTAEAPATETTESAEAEAPAAAEVTAAAPAETAPTAEAPAAPATDAATPAADTAAPETSSGTTPGGTQYVDVKVGTGPAATVGSTVVVHYTGTLTDGTKFDSSRDRNTPFPVTIGTTPVINGWTEGLVGMKAGGVRKLTIPADQAYGSEAKGPIPPNSTLLFDVEVLEVK